MQKILTETEIQRMIDRTFIDRFTKIDNLLAAILSVLQAMYQYQTKLSLEAPPGAVIVPVPVEPVIWTEGETLTVEVGTTPMRLKDDPIPCRGCTIKADDHNTGTIYWGFSSGVSAATGYPLEPSQSYDIPIDNLQKIWVIASASGQKARVVYGR